MNARYRGPLAALTLICATAAAGACLDSPPIVKGEAPIVEASDRDRPVAAGGVVTAVAGAPSVVIVRNAGTAPLELRGVTLESTPAGALVLTAVPAPSADAPVVVFPVDGDEAPRSWSFTVELAPGAAGGPVSGRVTLATNTTLSESNAFSFAVEVVEATPHLAVQPVAVDFGQVAPGQAKIQTLALLNTGNAPLTVTHVLLAGHPGFALLLDGQPFGVAPASDSGLVLDPPWIVAPGSSRAVTLSFTPLGAEGAEGSLWLTSNDATVGAAGREVPLMANTHGPCLAVNPSKVDFGGKRVGTQTDLTIELFSCGDAPLNVGALTIVGDSGEVFSVAAPPVPQAIAPGASLVVPLRYAPSAAAGFDDAGDVVPDTATLVITSDALLASVEVPLRGFGTVNDCPTPVIVVAEGEEVIPQTRLHLSGSQSFGTTAITSYAWTVQQPVGSASTFVPSASAADPVFDANVVGTYVFRLQVTDSEGNPGCAEAEQVVLVSSGEGIHIELLWTTPNDPDETDTGPVAGADLDLHFAHAFAVNRDNDGNGQPEPWFDAQYDAFWFNPQPNWGSLDATVPDDPRLDRDDTDGAGPENLNVLVPEAGVYRIGVHSWNDHGFGASWATVRVYIYGTLVFEWADVEVLPCAMWEVGTLTWPGGAVAPYLDAGGLAPRILPAYSDPYFANNCQP